MTASEEDTMTIIMVKINKKISDGDDADDANIVRRDDGNSHDV